MIVILTDEPTRRKPSDSSSGDSIQGSSRQGRGSSREDREREQWRLFHNENLIAIRTLLASHSEVFQGGDSFINMEELGSNEPGLPINAARIRRYFQDRPEEMRAVGRYFLDSAEAESHLLLEAKLAEWRRYMPHFVAPIDIIYFRSNAGHRDDKYQLELWAKQARRDTIQHTKGQREAAREAQQYIHNYHLALNQLAWWFTVEGVSLYATRPQRKAIRDAETNDQKHDEYYARYKDLLSEGKSAKIIYETLEFETGLSRKRLEEIISARRVLSGEAPRKRGRPRKQSSEESSPLATQRGKVWSRLARDRKAYEIGRGARVLKRVPLKDLDSYGNSPKAAEQMAQHIRGVSNLLIVKRFVENLKQEGTGGEPGGSDS